MHSSTSSSNLPEYSRNWLIIWLFAVFTFFSLFILAELRLQALGWKPSFSDSKELWAFQRNQASKLGKKAMIFLGSSRIQLGIDLDVVKNNTNLTPVQLAIEGNPFMPILENLASDPSIIGTVVISPNNMDINHEYSKNSKSASWVLYYETVHSKSIPPYQRIDFRITSFLNSFLITRMYGARPYTVIKNYLPSKRYQGGYIQTKSDRSRNGDYRSADVRSFYATRLQKHFGKPLTQNSQSYDEFVSAYEREIKNLPEYENSSFLKDRDYFFLLINKIEQRGGKIIIVRFPTDKLIWKIDQKLRPRTKYWDKLTEFHSACFHFKDYPQLSQFDLPDGSHLDLRDKAEFTNEFLKIMSPILNNL